MKTKQKVNTHFKAKGTVKSISVLVTVLLVLTTIPALSSAEQTPDEQIVITQELSFSTPQIVPDGYGYVNIIVNDEISGVTLGYKLEAGAPKLPIHGTEKQLPVNARNIEISFTPLEWRKTTIDGIVAPGPIPQYMIEERNYPVLRAALRMHQRLAEIMGAPVDGIQTHVNEQESFNSAVYASDVPIGDTVTTQIGVGRNMHSEMVIFANARIMPVKYVPAANEIHYTTGGTLTITYTLEDSPFPLVDPLDKVDFLILAPIGYIRDLQPLVEHKINLGFNTKLVSLSEINAEKYFENPVWIRDQAEQVKYFIYNAYKHWDVTYVMAVGGFRTFWGLNDPTRTFPVRASNAWEDLEPYYITDQYFNCFLRYDPVDGIVFDTWDSNNNNRFAEWDFYGYDIYDPFPDVHWGRLACTSRIEVRTMVDKIIFYETNTYGQEWFNTMLTVAGNGFQCTGFRTPLTVPWNVSQVPAGDYIIYAQSEARNVFGPVDQVRVTVDHAAKSVITFSEQDHLKIEPLTKEQTTRYPAKPVAEIVVPSNNNIIGNTDVGPYVPAEAYIGSNWATVNYNAMTKILRIQSKAYDPQPMTPYNGPSRATLRIWINSTVTGQTIFGPVERNSHNWWENEASAEHAARFLGSSFDVTHLWTSNGGWFTMTDMLEAFSEGYGFVYVTGHANAMAFSDHYPGAPGGRGPGSARGWMTINTRYTGPGGDPLFPLDQLTNGHKQPVLLYSGCHSGQWDTSFLTLLSDPYRVLYGGRSGMWSPQGVAWWITRLPQGGSIATIGNTILASGYLGDGALIGLTGWIYSHFFNIYRTFNTQEIPPNLGALYTTLLVDYELHEQDGSAVTSKLARRHFEGLTLLGDPTLLIGGYPPETGALEKTQESDNTDYEEIDSVDLSSLITFSNSGVAAPAPLGGGTTFQVTSNPLADVSPQGFIYHGSSDGDKFIVSYVRQDPEFSYVRKFPGFAFSNGGALWSEVLLATPDPNAYTSLYSWVNDNGVQRNIGSFAFGPKAWGIVIMPDITNPVTWGTSTPYGWVQEMMPGRHGMAVTGQDTATGVSYGGVWTWNNGVYGDWLGTGIIDQNVAPGPGSDYTYFAGDCDHSTGWHYYVFEKISTGQVYIARSQVRSSFIRTIISGRQPDVAASDGWAYVAYQSSGNGEVIEVRRSNDNGVTWSSPVTIAEGSVPKILITPDGDVECYFIGNNDKIYKSISTDNAETWSTPTVLSDAEVNTQVYSPYQILPQAIIYNPKDAQNDLFVEIFVPTKGVTLSTMQLEGKGTITATMQNSGTTYLGYLTWIIRMDGISPLGEYLGGGPMLINLLRGRVFSGGVTSGQAALSVFELKQISSGPVFGLGHVWITVQIVSDDGVIAETAQEAFLLGGRILLNYPRE